MLTGMPVEMRNRMLSRMLGEIPCGMLDEFVLILRSCDESILPLYTGRTFWTNQKLAWH